MTLSEQQRKNIVGPKGHNLHDKPLKHARTSTSWSVAVNNKHFSLLSKNTV